VGARGPRPKPSALKHLEGTFRKDRAPVHEPEPTRSALAAPAWLAGDAREEWERVAPELDRLNLSTVVDYATFLGYCMSYARALQAEEEISLWGLTMSGLHTTVANPAVAIARLEWAQVRKFAAEFGLTPAARTRVNGKPDEEPKDRAKMFLFGAKKKGA
jgi:P27 family predicted phage terminase small subunit